MTSLQHPEQPAAIVTGADSPVAAAIASRLRSSGWRVERATGTPVVPKAPISGLVYEPGLLASADGARPGQIVDQLFDLVESVRPRLPTSSEGGARIVVVSSRDGLGWADRPHAAAASGALVAAARSLALQLAPAGVTVNVVAAVPPEAGTSRAAAEPSELTPDAVTAEDIARTVAFFLDDRSGYITGQVLYCCGGASLLSSLSV
ncbi:hypothetical protein BWI15_13590 [Kribbella sp. ALI-6-A]|uniref:SDR family oxidoreductase n=1 Tax=Kribbella sp. ALI-6-A TaxID=1933817 RepID=UPI00097C0389|nr:SDR family oxidoreductase [Kribbella sp. ALI-6-A]ONI74344.1 hypothetical protein BWI15_13590 [Kribbella sp. ALI-6-A]